MIKLSFNSLFNLASRHLNKWSYKIRSGSLSTYSDPLMSESEKLMKVNNSIKAFIRDMEEDGFSRQDIDEILEHIKYREKK